MTSTAHEYLLRVYMDLIRQSNLLPEKSGLHILILILLKSTVFGFILRSRSCVVMFAVALDSLAARVFLCHRRYSL